MEISTSQSEMKENKKEKTKYKSLIHKTAPTWMWCNLICEIGITDVLWNRRIRYMIWK